MTTTNNNDIDADIIKTARLVFNQFRNIAARFGMPTPSTEAFHCVLNGAFYHTYSVGRHGGIHISYRPGVDSPGFEVNWPGTGSQTWEVALAFGSALAHVAQIVSQCEAEIARSGLTPDHVADARDALSEIAKDARAELSSVPSDASLPVVETVIKKSLAKFGL